ncbi:MAG: nicotinate (nicotinamide) nucleotide adenylyltransferase [Muribaculaceae bacterium]|nr:nicotinate (nicotinamide) nucleotide adenylyltransferase [Muribaculaceae bacterium]
MKKIGLLGGSFNPVHAGHMMLAQYLAEFTDLDETWLLLSPVNPLKASPDYRPADEASRWDMLQIATRYDPRIYPCDIELSLPRPSYTAMTLRELRSRYAEYEFHLIIGADNWLSFTKWREPEFIISNFNIIIYPRPGYMIDASRLPAGVKFMPDVPVNEISSTFLRNAIASGHDVRHFLPEGVYDYIISNGLYKDGTH